MSAENTPGITHPPGHGWAAPESYWTPSMVVNSAWLEHAPFVTWLVGALRPSIFAELGTHNGFSFFTVCEASARLDTETRCFAVDTWVGDEHAGFYGDEVFNEVQDVVDRLYPDRATLLRGYFDDYASHFDAGSIDLLHIDGRHRYEDVKHDFETWLPAVADRGVVLFHDIAVVNDDFGVMKFWNEISRDYPSFSFQHCNGLGVLGIGGVEPALADLFDAGAEESEQIRDFYAGRGAAVTAQWVDIETQRHLRAEVADLRRQVAALKSSSSWKLTAPLRAVSEKIRRPGDRP